MFLALSWINVKRSETCQDLEKEIAATYFRKKILFNRDVGGILLIFQFLTASNNDSNGFYGKTKVYGIYFSELEFNHQDNNNYALG